MKQVANEKIMKMLRKKVEDVTQQDIEEMKALGIEIITENTLSDQGYVRLKKNGVSLVISKDHKGLSGLFKPYHKVVGHKDIKKVDFMGFFEKVRYPFYIRERSKVDKYRQLKYDMYWNQEYIKRKEEDIARYNEKIKETEDRIARDLAIIAKQQAEINALLGR